MAEQNDKLVQKVQSAKADAEIAEARAREEIAKQKVKDHKSKSRANKAKAFGKLPKAVKIAVPVVIVAVVVVAAAILPGAFSSKEGVTVSEASLKDAVSISKLSTAEFTYEGIAEKMNDRGDVDYHIYYSATANSGIDMSGIEFDIDEADKTITPKLPAISIDDPVIDESSLDYLPKGRNADMREVIEVCKADMREEAAQNSNLLRTAESNLRATIEALLMPIISSSGFSISWGDSTYAETEGVETEGDGNEND